MRKRANLSLILLAFLFAAAAVLLYFGHDAWWSNLLLYTAEAGLVGALADWFAVTVLFRHPFGMKWVPHTAIIPRKREKLIEGVAAMVEKQLLSKNAIMDKLMGYSIVEALIGWIERERTGAPSSLSDRIWSLLISWLRGADMTAWADKLDEHGRSILREANLSRYAGKGLRWLLSNSDFQKWLGYLIDYAAKRASAEETRQAIRAMMGKEKDKFVSEGGSFTRWLKQKLVDFAEAADAINLDEAADTMYRDLQSFMAELQNPEHELRVMIEARVLTLADQLEASEEIGATIESWKRDMLDELSLQPSIHAMLESAKSMLLAGNELKYVAIEERTLHVEDVKGWLSGLIAAYWEAFKSDEETKSQLDHYAKAFIRGLLEREHALIGKIARKTLEGFTEERLVSFVEDKVGTDLQRIRVNGAFIGAGVGALLYLFLHGVYAPLLELFV
ncbi:DUF445 domain-containing protein [Paenibacillus soyae]|uniref:DUF445 domain-containing protein n=1 Tax=Paenibacillus soyae TaxID=2969249 RepID=A0A9X2MS55_9BACL|nr:DUF445 domain-containing protein [Paenibacillus soyae]MCR2804843.1 DUF445 domain-containing protein [Paenibacillus soyae]